jgi:hypothetical protein
VACGAVHRQPYWECLVILGWALDSWDDVEGRCVLAGIDVDELDMNQLTSVCYSLMVDDLITFGVARHEARDALDKAITSEAITLQAQAKARMAKRGATPTPIERPKLEAEPLALTPDIMASFGLIPPGMPSKIQRVPDHPAPADEEVTA